LTYRAVSYIWVRNTLKQLVQVHTQDFLAEYLLRFESLNELKTIKKTAKGLLKQYPTSIRLYNTYAEIEWARGCKDVAQGVFSAALNMGVSNSTKDLDHRAILLWRTWTWALLNEIDDRSALGLLLSLPSGTPDTSTNASLSNVLRAKQYLSSTRDFLLSAGQFEHSMLHSECLALLEYLTGNKIYPDSQGHLSACLAIFTSYSQILAGREQPILQERYLESAARLLHHHTKTGPYRPALLREHLEQFINLFPDNLLFLSLYQWNESRLRVDNRVRNILASTVLANGTLSSHLFAVNYEMVHGTIHSVKSAFEHAIASTTVKSSAGLWKAYVLFCIRTPQFRGQAKEVWFRALKACPWAKELYIFGFECLRGSDLVEFDELKGTWRVMGEKELRVHVDLEDAFEDMDLTRRKRT
jgi:hypothetical protein